MAFSPSIALVSFNSMYLFGNNAIIMINNDFLEHVFIQ